MDIICWHNCYDPALRDNEPVEGIQRYIEIVYPTGEGYSGWYIRHFDERTGGYIEQVNFCPWCGINLWKHAPGRINKDEFGPMDPSQKKMIHHPPPYASHSSPH